MRTYLRMLRYLRPYWRRSLLTAVAIGCYAVLSGLSVLSVSPFIRILFESRSDRVVQTETPTALEDASTTADDPSLLQMPQEAKRLHDATRGWVERFFLSVDRAQALTRFCLLVLGLFLLKNLFHYLQTYLTAYLEQRTLQDVRDDLYRHISNLPLDAFVRQRSGVFIARIVNDVTLMRSAIVGGVSSVLRNTLMILFALGIIFFSSWKLALVALFILPPNALLIAKLGRRLRRSSHRAQERMADMTGVLQETIAGARVVKAFGMHDFEARRFAGFNREYFKSSVRMRRLGALAAPISELLAVMGFIVILGYGGRLVLAGEMRADMLFLFLTSMLWLAEPVRALTSLQSALQEGIAAGERVFGIMALPTEPPRHEGQTARFERELRFEKVTFGYGSGRPVLRDVDLRVRPGEIVALVGPSGAGKSTFVDLIPRFYEIDAGRILLDDIDVRLLSLDSLRSLLGIVTQEVILFNDTVRANIAYGLPDISEDRIEQAARAANAHEFILRLSNGYDTEIGDRGVGLSGGERQRLSIARAILRDPQILILDEATSSLDTESEKLIQDALDRLMRHRTTFVIAHRLSTIQHADMILVFENGRIVECGTHPELLAASGTYARLHGVQFR